ncbi:hypothetical protein ACTHGU_18380 [Chitinophagaceae bacterium MMS25-I14]
MLKTIFKYSCALFLIGFFRSSEVYSQSYNVAAPWIYETFPAADGYIFPYSSNYSLSIGDRVDDFDPSQYRLMVTGNVGINDGNITFFDWNIQGAERKITGNANDASLTLFAQSSFSDGPAIRLWGNGTQGSQSTIADEGMTLSVNGCGGGAGRYAFTFLQSPVSGCSNPNADELMIIRRDGYIQGMTAFKAPLIQGTSTVTAPTVTGTTLSATSTVSAPTIQATSLLKAPALNVCGLIRAKQVKIDAGTGWCDYVFEKNYKLMPLQELKTYLSENKHLPEIPAQKEVEQEGVEVAEITKMLLKKVEELTLYTIRQSEQIDVLQAQVKTLSAKK